MMKVLIIIHFLMVANIITAQNTLKPASKTTANTSLCKNMTDSFSYALGIQVAGFYRQQGVKKINATLLAKAITDMYANQKLSLSSEGIDLALIGGTDSIQYQKLKSNLSTGKKFLEENKKKNGVSYYRLRFAIRNFNAGKRG